MKDMIRRTATVAFAACGLAVSGWSIASCAWPNPDLYCLAVRLADRREFDKAIPIWEDLSKQGDCDADWQLGLVHFMGVGGNPQDVAQAMTYWNSAANRGQPRAQLALGEVYFRNPEDWILCSQECGGIAADPVAAYKWYLIAKRNATYSWDKDYLRRVLPLVVAGLTDEQKAAAEAAAAAWQPEPALCKARKST